jgi:hypothetical protein
MRKILLFKFLYTLIKKHYIVALALKSFESPWSISITNILIITREFN